MYFDILACVVLAIFAIMGYWHGFIRQMLSLFGLISILLFAPSLAEWLQLNAFKTAPIAFLWCLSAIAIFSIFVGLHFAIIFAQGPSPFKPIDRALGASFGTLKGLIIVLFAGTLLSLAPERTRDRFEGLQSDMNKSYFVWMSQGLMSAKMFATFDRLQEAYKKIHASPNFGLPSQIPSSKAGPWGRDISTDSDE